MVSACSFNRSTGTRSSHSRCAPTILASFTINASTLVAISRSFAGSSPITRKLTGQGTGGPNNKRVTRIRASLNMPWSICCCSNCMMRSRAAASCATINNLAKAGSGCSGLAEIKNRGAPAPIKADMVRTSAFPASNCSSLRLVASVFFSAVPCGR